MQPRDKVKGPILIPFSLVILLGLGGVLWVAFQYEDQAHRQDLDRNVRLVERVFKLQIDNDASRLDAALYPISVDNSLQQIFIDGDRASLLARTSELFENLRQQHRITHFYFLDPQRRVVLRVHQPAINGDIINRITAIRAEQTRRPTYGIELGPLGTLTLRAVTPWFHRGTLIGYLELGEEINHVIDEVHQALDVDFMVLLNRQFLKSLPGKNRNSAEDEAIIFSSTLKNLPPQSASRLVKSVTQPDHFGLQSIAEEHPLHTALFPLLDAGNREIGNILVIRDVTRLQAEFHQSLIAIAGFTLLAGGVAFLLFYIILDRVEKDYQHKRRIETQFAQLSTEHKRIVQLEKLSEIGRTISEIAHQVNNPLVGVVNMAQMAQRVADDPVQVRQLLAEIRQAGEDSRTYLQRMLKFSRVSHSEIKPVEISQLIQETIDLFIQSTQQHPVVECALPAAPLTLNIDPVLIRHALFNLLTNAAQLSPAGSKIKVQLKPEKAAENRPGWSLRVVDQGPGMSAEVQEKIFTAFFTTQSHGTGLGLSVVQHVAILHNGIATGENNPAGGAVFAIWLPNTPETEGHKRD